MANLPIFLAAIVETLLVVTNPDSSIQNPAAIHMTRNAQTKNENVLKIYATSISTAAYAPEFINNEQIKNPIK
jgi:hypothetical protein